MDDDDDVLIDAKLTNVDAIVDRKDGRQEEQVQQEDQEQERNREGEIDRGSPLGSSPDPDLHVRRGHPKPPPSPSMPSQPRQRRPRPPIVDVRLLVTGASRGFGRSVAVEFASALSSVGSLCVTLVSRSADELAVTSRLVRESASGNCVGGSQAVAGREGEDEGEDAARSDGGGGGVFGSHGDDDAAAQAPSLLRWCRSRSRSRSQCQCQCQCQCVAADLSDLDTLDSSLDAVFDSMDRSYDSVLRHREREVDDNRDRSDNDCRDSSDRGGEGLVYDHDRDRDREPDPSVLVRAILINNSGSVRPLGPIGGRPPRNHCRKGGVGNDGCEGGTQNVRVEHNGDDNDDNNDEIRSRSYCGGFSLAELRDAVDLNVTSSAWVTTRFVRHFFPSHSSSCYSPRSSPRPSDAGIAQQPRSREHGRRGHGHGHGRCRGCSVVSDVVVVNVSSLCAMEPFPTMGPYCTGKAARDMYHATLAVEMGVNNDDIQEKSGKDVDSTKFKNEEEKEVDIDMEKFDSKNDGKRRRNKVGALGAVRVRTLNYAPGPMRTDMTSELAGSDVLDPKLRSWYRESLELSRHPLSLSSSSSSSANANANGAVSTRKEKKAETITSTAATTATATATALVEPNESAKRLVRLILRDDFVSGSHVDYYDVVIDDDRSDDEDDDDDDDDNDEYENDV